MYEVFVALDRSGSMGNNWPETIGALNLYVSALAKPVHTKKGKVTLYAVDSGDPQVEVIRKRVKVTEWVPVTQFEVTPRAMTPLYDGIRFVYNDIIKISPEKATIVFITDGQENASKNTNKAQAAEMIEHLKSKGYDIVFIGADFDAFGQGVSVGVGNGSTLNMTKGSYGSAMRTLSMRNAVYASGVDASTLEFSEQDRTNAVS